MRFRLLQLDARIPAQGTDEYPLGSFRLAAVAFPDPSVSLSQSKIDPVGCPIDAAMKAFRVHKCLQQQQSMTETCLPIRNHTPLHKRQHSGADIRAIPAGQNQESTVVGNPVQAAILDAKVPSDPTITYAALQRRCRQAQLRDPLLTPRRHIPNRLANLIQRAQIMVARHFGLILFFFTSFYRS